MKHAIFISSLLLFFACGAKKTNNTSNEQPIDKEQEVIIDSTNLILAAVVLESGRAIFIDTLENMPINKDFDAAMNFSEGLAGVKVGNKWGYIDIKGNMVIEPRFDFVYAFHEGLACVSIKKEQGYAKLMTDMHGFIDRKGNMVIENTYVGSGTMGFYEGLAGVAKKGESGWEYVFINKNGQEVISSINGEPIVGLNAFCDGLAEAKTYTNTYAINKQGEIVPDAVIKERVYTDFGRLADCENRILLDADYITGKAEYKEGMCGYKDNNGNWVIKPKYKSTSSFVYSYKDVGMKKVAKGGVDQSVTEKDDNQIPKKREALFECTPIGPNVNVRKEASATSDVVFQLNKGEYFEVMEIGKEETTLNGKRGHWYRIYTMERHGYIFSAYTKCDN